MPSADDRPRWPARLRSSCGLLTGPRYANWSLLPASLRLAGAPRSLHAGEILLAPLSPLPLQRRLSLHQEVSERRPLPQDLLPFWGNVAQKTKTLPGQVALLLELSRVQGGRVVRRKVDIHSVHPLAS